VIYRELFLLGLTVLDVLETTKAGTLSMSHLAARQEVRELLKCLRIPAIERRVLELRSDNTDPITAPKIAPVEKKPAAATENAASAAPAPSKEPEVRDAENRVATSAA